MEWLSAWWQGMTAVQQMFACAAVPATIILILQTVLLVFGLGSGGDTGEFDHGEFVDGCAADAADSAGMDYAEEWDAPAVHDFDGQTGEDIVEAAHGNDLQDIAGLRLFTVRGFVAFFAVGGWLGVVLIDAGLHTALAVLFALLGGTAALFGVAYLLKWSMRLQENGTLNLRDTVTRTGTVYIPIPAKRSGMGKITLTAQSQFLELDAITDAPEALTTGTAVQVVGVFAGNTLIVRPLVQKE